MVIIWFIKIYQWGLYRFESVYKLMSKGKNSILPDGFYKIYHSLINKKIRNDIYPLLIKYKNSEDSFVNIETKDVIWVLWWQTDSVPELVSQNIGMMKKNISKEVIVLNEVNVGNYIDIPDDILNNVKSGKNTMTLLSDYIRTRILYEYGGIWLDSTILVMEKSKILELPLNEENRFVTIKGITDFGDRFISQDRWTIYCIGGCSHQSFFKFVNEGIEHYLLDKDLVPDYFLTDHLFDIAYEENIGDFKNKVRKVLVNNVYAERLAGIINESYNKKELQHMCKNKNTTLFKLSNKSKYVKKNSNGDVTFYGELYGLRR